jgi:hypothetical protein
LIDGLGGLVLGAAIAGPYSTAHKTYRYAELDIMDRGIEAVYPTGAGTAGRKFPVIS